MIFLSTRSGKKKQVSLGLRVRFVEKSPFLLFLTHHKAVDAKMQSILSCSVFQDAGNTLLLTIDLLLSDEKTFPTP